MMRSATHAEHFNEGGKKSKDKYPILKQIYFFIYSSASLPKTILVA